MSGDETTERAPAFPHPSQLELSHAERHDNGCIECCGSITELGPKFMDPRICTTCSTIQPVCPVDGCGEPAEHWPGTLDYAVCGFHCGAGCPLADDTLDETAYAEPVREDA